MTRQPEWEFITNLGDQGSPIDYGGYFVYRDKTGVYDPEGEMLFTDDENDPPKEWTVYRFSLDRLKQVEDEETHIVYLVPFEYAEDWPHAVSEYDEWFHKDLAEVARFVGTSLQEMRAAFCSEDPLERAWAYKALGDYHGYENLDSYPLKLTSREEVENRYEEELKVRWR